MGNNKKKRGHPDVEEILARPWCYYCERDFDDLKILISHQKARHFKCERCGRRLNTAGGLSVHMSQVHKESLSSVENSLPNRANLDVEIFGMEGIPEDIVQAHNQRILTQFHQAAAERQALTGNPAPGTPNGPAHKKPKHESAADLKKRLAEHKAKKAAEAAAGISSGDNTPIGSAQGGQSPAVSQSPIAYAGSPQFPPQSISHPPTTNSPSVTAYPTPYGQPAVHTPFNGYAQNGQPLPVNQQYQGNQVFPMNFHNAYAGPRPYGTNSPPPFIQQRSQQNRANSPQNGALPHRPGSLPPAPSLPQRPSFSAPQVNAFQMQQMHQGQIPTVTSPPNTAFPGQQNQASGFGVMPNQQNGNGYSNARTPLTGATQQPPGLPTPPPQSAAATSVDDLLASAAREADSAAATPKPETKPDHEHKEKKKGHKDKATRLVYSDNETSPEEKMARLPRYAFVPDGKTETSLVNAVVPTAAGPDAA
ncbi:MAG: hypothetical protein M1834_005659 [Cirrosporium novae-zelandiae]|nr:MAG: hypothetical protein M1834_005659 [Cirrosporium novae-zelandiae]